MGDRRHVALCDMDRSEILLRPNIPREAEEVATEEEAGFLLVLVLTLSGDRGPVIADEKEKKNKEKPSLVALLGEDGDIDDVVRAAKGKRGQAGKKQGSAGSRCPRTPRRRRSPPG